ncbi:hypothetical protein JOF29_003334 [Kribbella aluminosa]|uniref:Lipoprotein n=1 Tax=Kribbella aluminosa TaxID=416017 RepID=A0ABS4UKS2_9ACTN|nr:hypothetical protein [Kribbella aluminosa]MBP2352251.1 hypothetical protein [Kribbella aluminosa]
MRKLAALAAVVTMSVGALTACSGGNYCNDLKSYVDTGKNLDTKKSGDLDKILSESKKVEKSAPKDLKDDWKVVVDYIGKVKDANGDTTKLAELAKSELPKIQSAQEAITKQAKDSCKIDMNSTGN